VNEVSETLTNNALIRWGHSSDLKVNRQREVCPLYVGDIPVPQNYPSSAGVSPIQLCGIIYLTILNLGVDYGN